MHHISNAAHYLRFSYTVFYEKYLSTEKKTLNTLVISGIALAILSRLMYGVGLPFSAVLCMGYTSTVILILAVLKLLKGKRPIDVELENRKLQTLERNKEIAYRR